MGSNVKLSEKPVNILAKLEVFSRRPEDPFTFYRPEFSKELVLLSNCKKRLFNVISGLLNNGYV